MNCKQAEQNLVDYLYGELPAEHQKEFEQHLEICPHHAEEVKQMQSLLRLIRCPEEEMPENLTEKIMRSIRTQAERPQKAPPIEKPRFSFWQRWLWSPVPVAVMLGLLVVTVGLGIYRITEEPHPENTERLLPPEIPTQIAKEQPSKPAGQDEAKPREEVSSAVGGLQRIDSTTPKAIEPETHNQTYHLSRSEKSDSPGPAKKQPRGDTAVLRDEGRTRSSVKLPSEEESEQPTVAGSSGSVSEKKEYRPTEMKRKTTKELDEMEKPAKSSPEDPDASLSLKQRTFSKPPPTDDKIGDGNFSKAGNLGEVSKNENQPLASSEPEERQQEDQEMTAESVPATAASETKSPADSLNKKSVAEPLQIIRRAEQLMAEQHFDQAISEYRSFLTRFPNQPQAKTVYYRIAKALFQQGKCSQAIAAIQDAYSKAPQHSMAPSALLDLASCHIQLNQFREAAEVYQQIERKFPAYQDEAQQGLRRLKPYISE